MANRPSPEGIPSCSRSAREADGGHELQLPGTFKSDRLKSHIARHEVLATRTEFRGNGTVFRLAHTTGIRVRPTIDHDLPIRWPAALMPPLVHDRHPAAWFECETERVRSVPQVQGQSSGDPH